MYSRQTISYDEAQAYVANTLARARRDFGGSASIACAVTGSQGELIAFGAHDETGSLPRRLAARKAYSAVMFKRETGAVRDAVAAGQIDIARLNDAELLAIPGGSPVVVNGVIIGAIGVSGLAPNDDAAVAAATVA
jgi:glc operon protein GlcG